MSRPTGTLVAYLVATILCLSSAWWVYRHPEADAQGADGVPIFDLGPDSVQAVVFTAENFEVSIERRTDGAGEYWWVDGERTPSMVEGVPPGPPEKEGAFSFKGGSSAVRLIGMLEPPTARRVVASTDIEARLDEYGLDPAAGELEIRAAEQTNRLLIGQPSAGGRSSYGYRAETATLYLLDRSWVDLILDGDSRLMDRRLYVESTLSFVRAEVALHEGAQETTVTATRDDTNPAQPVWVQEGRPVAWVGVSFALAVAEYVDEARWVDAVPVLDLRYTTQNNGPEVSVEVRRTDSEAEPRYLAKTRYSRSPVELRPASVERLMTAARAAG